MSIEAATGIIALLLTVASTILGLFVKNKIAESEDRMMVHMAQTYITRELANERFANLDRRVDIVAACPTPRRPHQYGGNHDEV